MPTVHPWEDLRGEFDDTLLLGNGASIAFDGRFSYRSLYESAQAEDRITEGLSNVFKHLKTTDFEKTLRVLWHAQSVNEALEVSDNATSEVYRDLRSALIETVRSIHVEYADVAERLDGPASFLSHFSSVFSLNYDLLVYWAIMFQNSVERNRIKDCFLPEEFEREWQFLRRPYKDNDKATLVFYPHGNLALGRGLLGAERKILAEDGENLLETIFQYWKMELTPLYVSEGTSEQKLDSILSSPYLASVYHDAMRESANTVTVFGCSLDKNDQHIIDGLMNGTPPERWAIAVDPEDEDLDVFFTEIRRRLKKAAHREVEVLLFDRTSPDAWLNREEP
jgi:uncharacterized protein DUF4917